MGASKVDLVTIDIIIIIVTTTIISITDIITIVFILGLYNILSGL